MAFKMRLDRIRHGLKDCRLLDSNYIRLLDMAYMVILYRFRHDPQVKGNIPRISSYTWLFAKNTDWFVVLRSNP